ncbi:transmembrane protein 208 [Schistocerca americana]|uniref:transmembrane protein 208 n=1 Tax=Schistocerca americana TaxID=7009 RepID=UPI001F4FB55A|nr:transmembrane protein 208 [Schistocerca americana]XP_047114402.1 transmembrane protein 208 [Schistocerca piceifrons]XP_049960077.1 transmembrane protein 208 [Schistocerca serialis cubense]
MAPQKGKQATKGQKQIVEENMDTLHFYRKMVFVANGVYLTVTVVLSDVFTVANILFFLLAAASYIGSYQFMAYMAKPKYTESGQLVDSGVDLNMEGGIAEHVKDLLILTSACQMLSIFSNYFWLLWLLAPIRGFWLLWVTVLSPWFFQQAPREEIDEKKQRKLERRMKRH